MNTAKLLTANLFKERVNARALADVLSRVKPDLLAVQELTASTADLIAGEFGYSSVSPFPGGTGIGVAALRPIAFSQLPMPHRPGAIATLQPDEWPEFGGPVEVIVVHLVNPIKWPPWRFQWLRRGQVNAITSHAELASRRQVLCGDLNATPAWPAYRRLRHHLRDGILEANARDGGRPARTWAPSRFGPRLLRIDHVLVNGLSITATETVPVAGSDHLAVLAALADDL